jgi:cholesterol oxidase
MTDHFDAVIVGSGFGASVMAYRLADAGKSVCVLERGRRYPPGSFPRTPRAMARNVWDPKAGLFGLFDIWSFRKLEAVVSSGLGGGSLIYANVLIRKDEQWFVDDADDQPGGETWPVVRADLDPHYAAVEKMLGGTPYPYLAETPKTREFRAAAGKTGLEWYQPNLAITFARGDEPPSPGVPFESPNLHGRPRLTCQLCGECDVGCNAGSKNTLDFTYLSRACEKGADVRTLAEVRRIGPIGGPGGGFRIVYLDHSNADGQPEITERPPEQTVTADRLVLGAGTFGTTYLLLRNHSAFPHLGPALGTHFSGNGDLLTFLRRSRRNVDGTAVPRWLDPSVGPVITSAVRVGDTLDGDGSNGRGFYIEDGGYPQFADYLVEAGGAAHVGVRVGAFLVRRVLAHALDRPRSNISADIARLFNRGISSSTLVPLLAMGRDVPNGVMSLDHGGLAVDWDTRASEEYFSRVQDTIAELAGALGASVANWPLWLFKRVITVHPLGGCPMGADATRGVVDEFGEAFNYPGLHVVDGSAMPGPIGPNPSLTIAAFANRAADSILGERA